MKKRYVSTGNSFASLSDDHEYTEFLPDSRLNSSCPDLHTINMEEKIEELLKQNRILKEKLQIAENEIENILLENSKLKKVITNSEIKTKYLTKICNSSSEKNITLRKNRKTLNGTVLDFFQDEQDQKKSHSQQVGDPAPSRIDETNYLGDLNGSSTPCHRSGNCLPNHSHPADVTLSEIKKKHINIIGDQQVRGLAEQMTKMRSGKWNDNYTVSGMVKPSALSSQILKSCEHLDKSSLTKDDILILSVGSNDRNPNEIITNICNTLCKLRECRIFLLSVLQNHN